VGGYAWQSWTRALALEGVGPRALPSETRRPGQESQQAYGDFVANTNQAGRPDGAG
jgi:hypothetical protein